MFAGCEWRSHGAVARSATAQTGLDQRQLHSSESPTLVLPTHAGRKQLFIYPACVGTATGSCNSPGNSPGAAAPGNVLLHFIQKPSLFRTRAASRTCRLRVFKEVHPTISSFLETVEFTDDTEISSSDKLLQRFMTR